MKQKGFTLVEVMISLFIGGLVLGGVMFTYIGMKVTTKDTMTIGELQESGRLAINIMQRDIEQRGRSMQSVIDQYKATVRPMFYQFIEPSIGNADLVVTRGGKNRVAIDLIKSKITQILQ